MMTVIHLHTDLLGKFHSEAFAVFLSSTLRRQSSQYFAFIAESANCRTTHAHLNMKGYSSPLWIVPVLGNKHEAVGWTERELLRLQHSAVQYNHINICCLRHYQKVIQCV